MALRGMLTDNDDKIEQTAETDVSRGSINEAKEITCSACGVKIPEGSQFYFSCGTPTDANVQSKGIKKRKYR